MNEENLVVRLPFGLEIVKSSAFSVLLKEMAALYLERDTLQVRCEGFSAKVDVLTGGRATLMAERDTLIADRATIVSEIDSLRAELQSLALINRAFIAENESLVSENAALTAKVDVLTAGRTTLMAERDTLVAERATIVSELDSLRAELQALVSVNRAVVAEKESLASENAALIKDKQSLTASAECIISLANTTLLADRLEQLGSLLRMKRVDNFPMIRVGGPFDGGYVCIDDFDGLSAAISVGVGTDVSWDTAIADINLVVHQYDHTVPGPPSPHANFRFHRVRLQSWEGDAGMTIGGILSSNGLDRTASVIGKIDIEGDEWDVLSNVSSQDLACFSQFICEFHWLSRLEDSAFFEKALLTFQQLAQVFEPVHVHANNWSPLVRIGNKIIPDVVEITFANKQRYAMSVSEEVFPTAIDTPNAPHLADYALGKFKY